MSLGWRTAVRLWGISPRPGGLSTGRRAFDLSTEDPRRRDQYGRHNWGQSVLLARRLVEAGSTFVTVHFGGWDHHWDLKAARDRHSAIPYRAGRALFDDRNT